MKEGRTTGGLIPIKGYVGNHGYNDAAQMMKSIMEATDHSYIRPKFEVFKLCTRWRIVSMPHARKIEMIFYFTYEEKNRKIFSIIYVGEKRENKRK